MSDPARVGRVWAAVAVAVATEWVVEVGGLAEHEERAETVPPVPAAVDTPGTPTRGRPAKGRRSRNRPGTRRLHRVFTRGLAEVMAGLLNGQVKTGRFVPERWPAVRRIPRLTEAEFDTRE